MPTHHLSLALITIIAILFVGGNTNHSKALPQQQLQQSCSTTDGTAVLLGCLNFIEKEGPKVPPSSDCCGAIKTIGMNCTCEIITKEIEGIISMEKLAYVAQSCGQPLAHGTQCGSYKVPAA